MSYIHLVTGGERSGKSGYAQALALTFSKMPIYLATSRVWDKEYKKRIDRHIADRKLTSFITIEEEKHLSRSDIVNKTVVVDCITLWLTNIFVDVKYQHQKALVFAKKEYESVLKKKPAHLIVISNEIGMGVHASTSIGRKFVELQGWMNQYIAKTSTNVSFMISGLPLKVK